MSKRTVMAGLADKMLSIVVLNMVSGMDVDSSIDICIDTMEGIVGPCPDRPGMHAELRREIDPFLTEVLTEDRLNNMRKQFLNGEHDAHVAAAMYRNAVHMRFRLDENGNVVKRDTN